VASITQSHKEHKGKTESKRKGKTRIFGHRYTQRKTENIGENMEGRQIRGKN